MQTELPCDTIVSLLPDIPSNNVHYSLVLSLNTDARQMVL